MDGSDSSSQRQTPNPCTVGAYRQNTSLVQALLVLAPDFLEESNERDSAQALSPDQYNRGSGSSGKCEDLGKVTIESHHSPLRLYSVTQDWLILGFIHPDFPDMYRIPTGVSKYPAALAGKP